MSGETTVVPKGKISGVKQTKAITQPQSPIDSGILAQKLRVSEINNRNANRDTLSNSLFTQCCKLAKVEPSTRQASKWRNKRGAAWTVGRAKLAEESR